MSAKRRVKGWWVICLMAGLGAQPLFAVEAGAISRAVEVAPPKGWTPDTPLFHDEPTSSSREAAAVATKEEGARAPNVSARGARRLEAAEVDRPAPVQRTRAQKLAERSAAAKRAPGPKVAASSREVERRGRATAGKGASKEARGVKRTSGALASARAKRSTQTAKAATPRTAAAKRSVERHAGRLNERSASTRRLASVARPASSTVARSAKSKRAPAGHASEKARQRVRGFNAHAPAATASPSLR